MTNNTQIRFKYGERENAIEIVKPEGYDKTYPNLLNSARTIATLVVR